MGALPGEEPNEAVKPLLEKTMARGAENIRRPAILAMSHSSLLFHRSSTTGHFMNYILENCR
jgi:hypothetical protein